MDNFMKNLHRFEAVLLQDQVDRELITYMDIYIMISVLKNEDNFH